MTTKNIDRSTVAGSPVNRIIFGNENISEFGPAGAVGNDPAVNAMVEKAVAILRANKADGSGYDERGKISPKSIADLAAIGFWGTRIDKEYGGFGADFSQYAKVISDVAAAGFATEAGVLGLHSCIGLGHSLNQFGSKQQKDKYLRKLATGEKMSGFALTEPGAGTDVSAISTTARRVGDEYLVTGQKMFVGNLRPGQLLAFVCKVEGEAKPAVFIAEFPASYDETFQEIPYDIYAVRQFHNKGARFNNFRIPAANRLEGNNIHYHGLNYGRLLVDANAAGVMRFLLRGICGARSWGEYRETFKKPIQDHANVKKRIARLASLIIGADAQRDWCSTLLRRGDRAELECTIAKVFAADALREAAIEIGLRTHGGRSFIVGHDIGTNFADFMAPTIYEGENDVLSGKFFALLTAEHAETLLKPLGSSIKAVSKGKVAALGGALSSGAALAAWTVKQQWKARFASQTVEGMDARLQKHVNFALRQGAKLSLELSSTVRKYGNRLGEDMQSLALQLSMRAQDVIMILTTAMHGHNCGDVASIAAADLLCQSLNHKLTGARPGASYYKDCNRLAEMVIAGQFKQLDGTAEAPILHRYK